MSKRVSQNFDNQSFLLRGLWGLGLVIVLIGLAGRAFSLKGFLASIRSLSFFCSSLKSVLGFIHPKMMNPKTLWGGTQGWRPRAKRPRRANRRDGLARHRFAGAK
jgi:hypothetical protein